MLAFVARAAQLLKTGFAEEAIRAAGLHVHLAVLPEPARCVALSAGVAVMVPLLVLLPWWLPPHGAEKKSFDATGTRLHLSAAARPPGRPRSGSGIKLHKTLRIFCDAALDTESLAFLEEHNSSTTDRV